jgi:hypothetical protein
MSTINFHIYSDFKTILEHFSGDIKIKDIIRVKQSISTNSSYSPKFNVIMDFREAHLVFDTSKVSEYVRFANNYPKIYGERKTAFITSRPNEVVITTIFGLTKGDLPIDPRTFSTLQAALLWMGLPAESFPIIENKLEQFKNTATGSK